MGIPGSANPVLLSSAGGYNISRSLRFNSGDSAYLSRTPASAGNRTTWTWAGWVKRSALSYGIFEAGTTNNVTTLIFSTTSLMLQDFQIGVVNWTWTTSAVFRDFSAWYHIVVSYDTTQASSASAVKIYVNGVEQTITFATNNSGAYLQNRDSYVNSTSAHRLGTYNGVSNFADMYLADVHLVDGQALAPTSFGEPDNNGIWQPIRYAGTYGTNGFHLDFSDNSAATAAALGADSSGNGNNWTPNNLSVTAGAGNDSLVDVPTNGTETDTGAGGEVRGNYCTFNPLKQSAGATLSNGNLDIVISITGGNQKTFTTFGMSSGKWYCEITKTSGAYPLFGIASDSSPLTSAPGGDADSYAYGYLGQKWNNGSGSSYSTQPANGDIVGVAFDADVGTLAFYKNGTSLGTAFTGIPSGTWFIVAGPDQTQGTLNAGQRPFAYTAPSGFKALCTTNLTAPTIEDGSTVMDVVTYTGNSSTQTISGLGFSPDLLWVKSRSNGGNGYNNIVFDAVRGATKSLATDITTGEYTGTDLTSFNSDGFTVAAPNQWFGVNQSGVSFVAWTWDAGDSTVPNNDGSILSQVSANPSAGFSIVTYTGTGSAATVGHGLGVAPQMVIAKARTGGGSFPNWSTYHVSIGPGSVIWLNVINGSAANPNYWNNVVPTSTVFSVGNDVNGPNASPGTYVAYCFAPVAGYSAFGSYTGNGSPDGPFVYTGFRPAFVIIKKTNSTGNWLIYDNKRRKYNLNDPYIYANEPDFEGTSGSSGYDFLSNGFKTRNTYNDGNISGSTYIYAAFAENPFALNARAR